MTFPVASRALSWWETNGAMEVLDIVAYVFMDEAWILEAKLPPNSTAAEREEFAATCRAGLSEHPDRIEALMFSAEDAGGMLMARRVIIRGKALAGGINLILSPEVTIGMSALRALSPDGRSKAFDASADGFGRGEACGVIVLKRLSTALAAKDNILAVIRGSAINHDGASGGLMVPNGLAQESLLRDALARAGRLDDARLTFEKMLTYGNHLGLYSEEIGPTGEQLGNFPQAFSHLALISAAVNLDYQLDHGGYSRAAVLGSSPVGVSA